MKAIGLLGGIGPQATMDLEVRLHAVAQALIPPRGNGGYPPLVVAYHRRPPVIVGEDGVHPVFPIQPDPELLELARRLGGWADFLIIGSNGAHALQAEIEAAAGRPVLSMIEATLAEVHRRGWRHVGALGLGEPIIYTRPLEAAGLRPATLTAEERAPLDRAIIRLMEGRHGAEERATTEAAVESLRRREVDGVILGCTELPLLLGPAAEADDLINPAQLLAEAASRRAID